MENKDNLAIENLVNSVMLDVVFMKIQHEQ